MSSSSRRTLSPTKMEMFLVVAAFVIWTAIVSAVNQRSSLSLSFVGVRQGEVPIFQIWQMATYSACSLVNCAERCQVTTGCRGFLYEPVSCSGFSAARGFCQLVQFFDVQSVVFGPQAVARCQQLYTLVSPVKPVIPNLALNKPAIQRTTYQTLFASLAVDGNSTTIAASNDGPQPWWAVDLGQQITVQMVRVTNDYNPLTPWRLTNFTVGLTNTEPVIGNAATSYTVCAQFNGAVPASAMANVTCTPSAITYRYVVVQSSFNKALALAEVEVF